VQTASSGAILALVACEPANLYNACDSSLTSIVGFQHAENSPAGAKSLFLVALVSYLNDYGIYTIFIFYIVTMRMEIY
jgi:hypothetical protein